MINLVWIWPLFSTKESVTIFFVNEFVKMIFVSSLIRWHEKFNRSDLVMLSTTISTHFKSHIHVALIFLINQFLSRFPGFLNELTFSIFKVMCLNIKLHLVCAKQFDASAANTTSYYSIMNLTVFEHQQASIFFIHFYIWII